MKVYLAARYSRRLELCGYRDELDRLGFTVVSRWLDGSHQIDNAGVPIGEEGERLVEEGDDAAAAELRARFAIEDVQDVLKSNLLVAFTEEPRIAASRGGRHVELGIALGVGMPVMVVGPRENVFCWLPTVDWHATWASALDDLQRLAARFEEVPF